MIDTIAVVVGIKLAVFIAFGFYNRWWRYVSTRDMWGAARGVTAACIAADLVVYFAHPVKGFPLPRSIAVLDWLILLAFVAGSRLIARSLIERPGASSLFARGKEVIVVGAGDAAQLVIKEMLKSPALGYTPIGLIDDDPRKKNLRLHGIRVRGTTDDLAHILRDNPPDEVLIAIPSAAGETRQRVVEIAQEAGVPVKTLPGLYELISRDFDLAGQIRPIQVEDVLGREPVDVDLRSIASYVKGETVAVTGAGGSIGAELCRQIARLAPARLVLIEQSESALFDIERELIGERDFSAVATVLGDCGDRAKMSQVFERYRPSVVFHAAAYKHVALLEANPLESGSQQRADDEGAHRRGGRVPRCALRARLDGQGSEPEERDGAVEGDLRVDRRGVRAAAGRLRRASSRCGSATCSARPAASSRSSGARSSAAGR